MLKKLKQKWNVTSIQLVLIIFTFAIGGSLCGYVGRIILNEVFIENKVIWLIVYIVLITILWPISVLLISILLGQFSFFKNYITKIVLRLTGKTAIRIAIFASGNGSNAEKIYLTPSPSPSGEGNRKIKIALIVCNNPNAGVLKIAVKYNIPTLLIEKELFFNSGAYVKELKKKNIQFIVLAGFLWKIPLPLIKSYPNKIINIHPALLPKFGGKGMYGLRVHHAVINAQENESGITVHFVDEYYDNGDIIFQAKCKVEDIDTAETLAKKIQLLEHEHYPKIIQQVIAQQKL